VELTPVLVGEIVGRDARPGWPGKKREHV
jgi:hypothetical protein